MFFFVLQCSVLTNELVSITPSDQFVDILAITMPYIDNNQELIKDNVDEGGPIRYAVKLDVSFNPSNSGTWFNYNDNYEVWKLHINSVNAIGLKLLFDEFHLCYQFYQAVS